MKKTKTQTDKQDTNTDCQSGVSVTSVNTTYARACIILLACNFCFTGYIMVSLNTALTDQVVGSNGKNAPVTRTVQGMDNRSTAPLGVSPRVADPGALTPGTQEIPEVEPGINPR